MLPVAVRLTAEMKTASALVSLLLVVTHACAVEVGAPAPEFALNNMQRNVKLSDFKGKTVYLDFWASWCGPCKQSFPWMNEMQAKYAAQGLQVIAVNVDKKQADANAFLAQRLVQFEVLFDAPGQTPQAYAIKAMPTSLLIGPDGKVLHIHSGFRDEQRQVVEEQIKAALAAKR